MTARFAVALILAVAGGWVGAVPSAALEPGVHVDPGSPAGKEYTAPLSALRGEASGHPAARDQSEPLFGIGITAAGAASAAHGTGRSATTGSRAREPSRRPTRRGGASHSARAPRAGGTSSASTSQAQSAAVGVTGHGSAAPAIAWLSAAVVLGGLGLGALFVAVRRRLE